MFVCPLLQSMASRSCVNARPSFPPLCMCICAAVHLVSPPSPLSPSVTIPNYIHKSSPLPSSQPTYNGEFLILVPVDDVCVQQPRVAVLVSLLCAKTSVRLPPVIVRVPTQFSVYSRDNNSDSPLFDSFVHWLVLCFVSPLTLVDGVNSIR